MVFLDLFKKKEKTGNAMYLYTEGELEKYQQFVKEWGKILPLSYNNLLKEQEESNKYVLERKIQDWSGYNPKETESVSYGLVTKEYKFLKSDIKNKLRYFLINILDEDNLKCRCEGYKIEEVKLFSSNDYNVLINNDIAKLKEAISKADNLKEKQFEATIINNTKKYIYDGSKSINMLEIPQAKPEDLVVRIFYDKHFYSYEFLIIGKDKIIDVFFCTSD